MKLLGAPFRLSMKAGQVDQFLLKHLDKNLGFLINTRINSARKTITNNNMLISSMLYFLAISGNSSNGIERATTKIRNFTWIDTDLLVRTKVA